MKSQCGICRSTYEIFNSDNVNEIELFKQMREKVMSETLEFFAGNCPLEEFEKHMEIEDLYTIEHYFKCQCGLIYYIGFCIRGRPIIRVVDGLPNNIKKTMTNKYGSYFES